RSKIVAANVPIISRRLSKSGCDIRLQLRRLSILTLPLSCYFLGRQNTLLLNTIILFSVLFIAYLKYYLKIEIKPKNLGKIFEPEIEFIFLAAACFLSIFFFPKIIAMNILLFIILGNTFAQIAKERYGRALEIVTFAYVCLASSLFLLFFPLVFDWHIALLGCLAGAVIRLIKLPFNQDIAVSLTSGLAMVLLLT
ncbi:MAG: hypothetical protein AABY43_05865, partial [Candidatus Omnitrophota bacterium]